MKDCDRTDKIKVPLLMLKEKDAWTNKKID